MNQNFTKIMPKVLMGIFFYLLIPWQAFAQNNLTGTVLDDGKKPLPGVTVLEKGTKNGTITNGDGKFTLSLTKPDAVVVVKMVGYIGKELSAAGKSTLTFTIEEDNQTLSEVVMVGYQSISRKKSTAAISSISAKELANLPSASFDQLLQGRLSGVNVQNFTGSPGAAPTVAVRGNTAINSTYDELSVINSPLYVVDGVPQPNEQYTGPNTGTGTNYLAGLNPADIETIDVLKDASAAAIYGSRAASGVIMITTKKGLSGEPRINIDAYSGLVQRPELRDVTLGTSERRQKMEVLERQLTYADQRNLPYILTDSLNPAFNGNTDWQDLFYQKARINNVNLGLSGGSDNGMTYRFSGGYFNEEGIIKATGFSRYSGRLNLTSRALNQKLTINPMFSYTRTDRARGLNADDPANPVRLGAGDMPSSLINLSPEKAEYYLDTQGKSLDKNINNQFQTNLNLSYLIDKHLTLNSQSSYQMNNNRRDRSVSNLLNNGGGNSSTSFADNTIQLLISNNLNYNTSIGKHNLNAVVGQELLYNQYQDTQASGYGGSSDNIQIVSGFTQARIGASSRYEAFGLVSYFARLAYDYDSKYLLSLTGRADGSSKFGKDSKWGYFPSAAIGWIISEENFMKEKENNPISLLKLRASIGVSGNVPPTNYLQYNLYSVNNGTFNGNGGSTSYNGITAITPNFNDGAAQAGLSWEKNMQWNFGADMEFLNGKYAVSLDAYNKEGSQQLFDVNLPITTGYNVAKTNALGIQNRGYELTFRASPINGGQLKWNTNLNISFNKNKIMNLPNGNRDLVFATGGDRFDKIHILSVGQPLNAFYLYNTKGVYSTLADVPVNPLTGERYQSQGSFGAGDFWLEDLDGNYRLDVFNDGINPDKLPNGDPNPKWTGGFTNNFNYKNWNLNIFSTFTFDRDVMNLFDADRFSNSTDGNAVSRFASFSTPDLSKVNIWRNPGDNAQYAKYDIGTYRYYYTSAQSFFMDKGGYFRIKNVALTYNVPSKALQKIGIGRLAISGIMENVAMFQQSDRLPDAEAVNAYGEYKGGGYPIPKKYTLAIEVQF